MANGSDGRILGLSRRARRIALPALGIATALIIVGQIVGPGGDNPRTSLSTPHVGSELHAVATLGSGLFVGGHDGAGRKAGESAWTQISSLDDKDIMGWAMINGEILAGGHQGLYASRDQGMTFTTVPNASGLDLDGLDVHGLGASESIIYLASPAGGLFTSTDGGRSFELRSTTGRVFMGTIWVDPMDPDTAIAPSMQAGAVQTTNGGRTWTSLGGPVGAMSVTVTDSGRRVIVIGMSEAQQSTDGGAAWAPLDLPPGASAGTLTAEGTLITAAPENGSVAVYRLARGEWEPLD